MPENPLRQQRAPPKAGENIPSRSTGETAPIAESQADLKKQLQSRKVATKDQDSPDQILAEVMANTDRFEATWDKMRTIEQRKELIRGYVAQVNVNRDTTTTSIDCMLLAVQMTAMHNLAMEFSSRALMPEQSPAIVDSCVERANKCSRTFVAQIEALNRLRGQVQQKVLVEHVTVNPGGQAVVGNVNQQRDWG